VKIIHVDDHIYALEEMKLDLPQIVPEAELHSFNHPDQALAFAEAEGCDVLLTEIELWTERLGGIRLAKAIREINPCVSIIFVTVCSENEVARELSGLPVSGFLPKLWKSEELAETFRNLRCTAQ
jgi:two-component SAPR family response regulator